MKKSDDSKFEIDTKVVNAPSRKLKARWTVPSQVERDKFILEEEVKFIEEESKKKGGRSNLQQSPVAGRPLVQTLVLSVRESD